jgi:CRP-like cAMP-binding protein
VGESTEHSLSGIRLLQSLSREQLTPIEQGCRWKRYGAHEQIIDRQSESRDVYFIVHGRVRVVNYSLSGREITLDDMADGSHFGELAALDGQPRSASVMALTDSLLAALPPEQFLDAVKKYPDVSLKVMRQLAHIVRVSTDRIMDLSTLGANNRVHAELLRQARATMTGPNTATIKPIPVHGDVASRVSTTRETVARVMNDLARQGVVKRTKDSLLILDVDHLESMVQEVRGD